MSTQSIPSNNIKVCVTGATGFIASHIVYQLLLKGYTVHGTVRSLPKGKEELMSALLKFDQFSEDGQKKLSEEMMKERLICFEGDLLKEGCFEKAIEGCRFVQHTASPYKIDVKDPQTDLVDPALKGTLNVVNECIKLRKTQSNEDSNRLQRIILTSSIAAIVDTALPDKVYTEEDWNELSGLDKNPYFYSKVVAEKAAWKVLRQAELEHGNEFLELAVINPSAVVGRPIFEKQVNQSHESIQKIANGEFPAIFNLAFVFVDVKDVATAHVAAMEHEIDNRSRFLPSKGERFIAAGDETTNMKQMCDLFRELFPNPPNTWIKNVPSFSMEGGFGNAVAKFAGLFQPKGVRQLVNSSVGKPTYFSNKKIRETFGMTFMDAKTQIKISTEHLLKLGLIK